MSGSLKSIYSMCTHQAHVIKNSDLQNLMTFWTIDFLGGWGVVSKTHLLKRKIPNFNAFSRIFRHLEKILIRRFSLIFGFLGKSLRKCNIRARIFLCSVYVPESGLSSFSLRFDVPGVCKYLFLRFTKVKGVPWGPKVLIWRKKTF